MREAVAPTLPAAALRLAIIEAIRDRMMLPDILAARWREDAAARSRRNTYALRQPSRTTGS
jgi:hypothetical protein